MSEVVFVYDSANEALVLQAAIADKEVRKSLVRKLHSDEFLEPKHPPIWSVLRQMEDAKLEYTSETATRLLHNEECSEDVYKYLEMLEEGAKVPENLDWIVATLQWDSQRAQAFKVLVPKITAALNDPKAEQADVAATARSLVRSLEQNVGIKHLHRPEELHRQYKTEIESRMLEQRVYPIGFHAMDMKLSEGFMPRRTTVVAGLPGAGKSTVVAAWTLQLAFEMGRRPLVCAWEMEATSLMDVMISHMTGIELTRIIQGKFHDCEVPRVFEASEKITQHIQFMGYPFMDDIRAGKRVSNEKNLSTLEFHVAESGCDIAIYDLWERMLVNTEPYEVAKALYYMQDLHKLYNVHGIIVHQLLLKDVEKRQDKRPTREAIKGTGAYTEVADMIYGIHRPAQFKNVPDATVETICLKQRKGEANWAIQWKWDGARCVVRDPREVPYDPGLENAIEVGDIGDISEKRGGKRGRKKD